MAQHAAPQTGWLRRCFRRAERPESPPSSQPSTKPSAVPASAPDTATEPGTDSGPVESAATATATRPTATPKPATGRPSATATETDSAAADPNDRRSIGPLIAPSPADTETTDVFPALVPPPASRPYDPVTFLYPDGARRSLPVEHGMVMVIANQLNVAVNIDKTSLYKALCP